MEERLFLNKRSYPIKSSGNAGLSVDKGDNVYGAENKGNSWYEKKKE